jgi:hypothetical protein
MVAALITVMGLAPAGGCGPDSASGGRGGVASTSVAQQAAGDPKEQLVAGIRAVNSSTFRFVEKTVVRTVSNTSEGVVDPARNARRLTRSSSVAGKTDTLDLVTIGTDVYIRYDTPVVPGLPAGKWAHVDGRRTKSLQAMGVTKDEDPSGKFALIDAVVSIERTGPRALRGIFDFSKGSSDLSGLIQAFGAAARSAPWQARFDPENRLEWLSITVPPVGEVPAYTQETAYSHVGEPASIERPPAGSTIEAPEALYKIFNR